jgi:hypothetical protein
MCLLYVADRTRRHTRTSLAATERPPSGGRFLRRRLLFRRVSSDGATVEKRAFAVLFATVFLAGNFVALVIGFYGAFAYPDENATPENMTDRLADQAASEWLVALFPSVTADDLDFD